MKIITSIIFLLLITVLTSSAKAQISTNKNINSLINKSENDSIAQIERLAALEFHKLINKYRESKSLSPIGWDETLWIATKNHNVWMAEANTLSHHQTKKNKYYTGNDPGDRFNYAAGGNSPNSWSGENALYNYSAFGKNIKEIAENIASRSFNQWKDSPGHNQNMLGKSHVVHGVAFKVYGDMVWGTDLFASTKNPYSTNDDQIIYKDKKKIKKKTRFNTFRAKRDLITQVINGLNIKLKKNKNSEAKKKAYKLLSQRFKTDDDVLYSKHFLTKNKGVLKLIKKKKSTYSLVIEKNINEFDISTLATQLINLIKDNQPTNRNSKVDLSIALRKKRNTIRLTLVSITYPRSISYSF